MSLRSKAVFALLWQSAGKQPYQQWRFREIPTSRDITLTIRIDCNIMFAGVTMLLRIIAPLDDIVFTFLTLDLLQTHFILSKPILIQSRLIKFFDHEGRAVGVVVTAISTIVQTSRWEHGKTPTGQRFYICLLLRLKNL